MKTFVATGNTYPYREDFISWGWHWDSQRRAWIENNGSEPDELCIKVPSSFKDVTIAVEDDRKDRY